MKEKMKLKEMQGVEKKGILGKVLPMATLLYALSGSPVEGSAQTLSSVDEGVISTEVVKKDSIHKENEMMPSDPIEIHGDDGVSIEPDSEDDEDGVSIEPDPDTGDEDEGMLGDEGTENTGEKVEKTESPAYFSFQSGLGYSVTGGDALRVNRLVGSGKLFKGSKGEISVLGIADLDDPLHTKGSGKLILGKKLYKGISLDGDYTFTGTGDNVFRFGMGYTGQFGDGSYGVKLFPLNTSGSPMSAKVSISTKVGKNGSLSSFVFVDIDTKGYYSETEYVHKLAQGIAAFVQARLMGTMDGKFTGTDGQILMGGLKFDL